MAYRPNKLGRIALKVQGSGWGTPETSFATTTYVEAEVGIPVYTRESLRMDPLRSGFEECEVLPGSRAGVEIPLKFPLHGFSSANPSADPTEHPDALLIRCALGAAVQTGFVATNIASGGSTSSVKFTAASANWEGSALLIPTSGAPGFEAFFVKDADLTPTPDAVVPLCTLQRTPASSGTHFGSNTIYMTNDTPAPFTLDWIGSDSGHHIRYSDGLVKSLRIVGAAKKNPMVEATLRFTGTPTFPGAGGSLAAYTYDRPLIPPAIGANGAGMFFNNAWDTLSESTFQVDCTLVDVEGYGSSEGVAQQIITDRKVSATILQPLDGTFAAELLAPGANPDRLFVIYACSQPGRAAGFVIPKPVLIEQAPFADRSGILAVQYTMAPQVYIADDGVGLGAGNKSVRFFFA